MKLILQLIFVILPLLNYSQDKLGLEEIFRDDMDITVEELTMTCKNNLRNGVSDKNGNKEFWTISSCYNTNEIITISCYKKEIKYEELYIIQNGKLIYAKETEIGIPINSFEVIRWNCKYYFKNQKLYTHISLGHGKTEDEKWIPESINKKYKGRLLELSKMKKPR